MARKPSIMRGLRFRLTASYALFFAILLIGVAGLLRARLAALLNDQVHTTLEQEWAAIKGYLRVEKFGKEEPKAEWYYDPKDPDENYTVERLRRVYLLTDASGTNVLQYSTVYQNLGIDRPAEIQEKVRRAMISDVPGGPGNRFWTERRNPQGAPYLIRSGIIFDERHQAPYYLAIGLPLADNYKILNEFTLVFLGIVPASLILGSVLGWFMAGRALEPVLEVAQAAQRISGSNLSLRIPTRNANDELDYLILTFNRMIERLEASFQQIKQFSTDVSHELRTPITAIRGQLEVALFTAKTTEQYRDAMVNALQDIDRLSQIVRALLLLSQAESGQLALQKSRVDLSEIARDLVEQFQIPADAEGVRLQADALSECPAELDRVQIERMITNLLSNAVKFTPEGGKVQVVVHRLSDIAEIVVDDTGRGIAPEHLPHIFDRFYRVPGTGTAPGPDQGLGLGLSFVAWIVKAHNGNIHVESSLGKGTRFTIHLPLGQPDLVATELAAPAIMNEL
jgi:heavy metal sensor kinase